MKKLPKRLQQVTIATRLVASFAFVMLVFSMVVLFSNVSLSRADSLYRYRVHYLAVQNELLLEFHQEFTEFRRLLKASYYHIGWAHTVDNATRRIFEDALIASYFRMERQSRAFIVSTRSESRVFSSIEMNYKANTMEFLANYVDTVFNIFYNNFFLGSSETFYSGGILDNNAMVDYQLHYLRQLIRDAGEEIQVDIETTLRQTNVGSIIILILAAVPSVLVAYTTVKSFSNKMRHVESVVEYVKKGDLESCLHLVRTDEISLPVFDVILVFREIINEISQISDESKQGHESAFIDISKYEGDYQKAARTINQLIENIHATNEQVRFIFESIPLALTMWDKDNNIIDFNEEVVRRYGLSDREEYRHRFYELMPETQPDGSNSVEKMTRVLANAREVGRISVDLMHQTLSGEPIPTETLIFKAERHGEIIILSCSIDLRSVYESQEREREAIERMRLMFDATPLIIEYWDQDYNRIDSNEAAVEFFNLQIAQGGIINLDDIDFHAPKQPNGTFTVEVIRIHLEHCFLHGFSKFEYATLHDGKTVYLEVTCRRVKLKDGYVVVTYTNDITPIKEMMNEREKIAVAESHSQAKSRFLARMSHELRTPISAVLGISEIQLQKKLAPDTEEAFSNIYGASTVLIGILNDILDLSKIEAGKMPLTFTTYEMSSMIHDVIQMHAVSLESKKFKFQAEIDGNLPSVVLGDVLRTKQVLNNVLSNAFKYTEHGQVKFTVYHEDGAEENFISLVAIISDTGCGMTEEQLKTLQREEYVRFHEQELPVASGTGLGMPIVHNLVELMGATVDLKSQVHVGTTVILKIPLEVVNAEPIGEKTAQGIAKLQRVPKRVNFTPESMPYGKVLVVDDVQTNLYVAKGLLGLYNLQIETCINGKEAIDKIKTGQEYDIIFMDYMMPDLNGMEATKILREINYTHPIIALTANAIIGLADEFMANGFDGFIAKPIDTIQLHDVLIEFIKKRRGIEETIPIEEEFTPAPVDQKAVADYYSDPEILKMVQDEFIETQTNVMPEIMGALSKNEMETARRLAHTVKTMAQMMQDYELEKIAYKIETIAAEGRHPDAAEMVSMEKAVDAAIARIRGVL